jgi:hypothetical protein
VLTNKQFASKTADRRPSGRASRHALCLQDGGLKRDKKQTFVYNMLDRGPRRCANKQAVCVTVTGSLLDLLRNTQFA